MGGMCNLLAETSHQTLAASHPSSLLLVDHWVSLGVTSHHENSPRTICLSKFMKPQSLLSSHLPGLGRVFTLQYSTLSRTWKQPKRSWNHWTRTTVVVRPSCKLILGGHSYNGFFPRNSPILHWDSLFGFALMNCPGVSLRVRFPSGIGQLHFEWFTDDMQQFHRFRCQISWHRVAS